MLLRVRCVFGLLSTAAAATASCLCHESLLHSRKLLLGFARELETALQLRSAVFQRRLLLRDVSHQRVVDSPRTSRARARWTLHADVAVVRIARRPPCELLHERRMGCAALRQTSRVTAPVSERQEAQRGEHSAADESTGCHERGCHVLLWCHRIGMGGRRKSESDVTRSARPPITQMLGTQTVLRECASAHIALAHSTCVRHCPQTTVPHNDAVDFAPCLLLRTAMAQHDDRFW